jgi:hypothetical protein
MDTKSKRKREHPSLYIGGNNFDGSRNKSLDGSIVSPFYNDRPSVANYTFSPTVSQMKM